MSEQVGGTGPLKTGQWSVGTPVAQPSPPPAAPPTVEPRPAVAGDDGSFDGAKRLQAASTELWSGAGLGSSLGSSAVKSGTWTDGWDAGAGDGKASGPGGVPGRGGVGLWTVDVPLNTAVKELETAGKALDAMKTAALAELQAIRGLAAPLKFGQGGDVDALKVGRTQRFENYLAAAEKALQKEPMDVEGYRRSVADLRTVIDPPLAPKLPNGDSRHQTFWGKPVPGSKAVMAKLTELLNRAGLAGTKVTPTLYELRGNAIQSQSKVDTLRNAAEQRTVIQAKSAEFGQAKAAAEHAQNQFQQASGQVNGQFDAFFKGALQALDAKGASPEAAAARKELLRAENALKLSYFGSANQFLLQFSELAEKAGLPVDGVATLRASVSDAGRLHSERNKTQDRAKRVDQERQRMQAGYDEALRAV